MYCLCLVHCPAHPNKHSHPAQRMCLREYNTWMFGLSEWSVFELCLRVRKGSLAKWLKYAVKRECEGDG